ncbi:unnamed protein product [Protopolystoma xenopodis]|uniref:Uncharacterized protein n=1 Tax=Protopolystoma xenopodis TaxID=117903 RepID=A0A448WDR6_9PLAT|nr:unnamed protein product [Protopolystoma xenopodis]
MNDQSQNDCLSCPAKFYLNLEPKPEIPSEFGDNTRDPALLSFSCGFTCPKSNSIPNNSRSEITAYTTQYASQNDGQFPPKDFSANATLANCGNGHLPVQHPPNDNGSVCFQHMRLALFTDNEDLIQANSDSLLVQDEFFTCDEQVVDISIQTPCLEGRSLGFSSSNRPVPSQSGPSNCPSVFHKLSTDTELDSNSSITWSTATSNALDDNLTESFSSHSSFNPASVKLNDSRGTRGFVRDSLDSLFFDASSLVHHPSPSIGTANSQLVSNGHTRKDIKVEGDRFYDAETNGLVRDTDYNLEEFPKMAEAGDDESWRNCLQSVGPLSKTIDNEILDPVFGKSIGDHLKVYKPPTRKLGQLEVSNTERRDKQPENQLGILTAGNSLSVTVSLPDNDKFDVEKLSNMVSTENSPIADFEQGGRSINFLSAYASEDENKQRYHANATQHHSADTRLAKAGSYLDLPEYRAGRRDSVHCTEGRWISDLNLYTPGQDKVLTKNKDDCRNIVLPLSFKCNSIAAYQYPGCSRSSGLVGHGEANNIKPDLDALKCALRENHLKAFNQTVSDPTKNVGTGHMLLKPLPTCQYSANYANHAHCPSCLYPYFVYNGVRKGPNQNYLYQQSSHEGLDAEMDSNRLQSFRPILQTNEYNLYRESVVDQSNLESVQGARMPFYQVVQNAGRSAGLLGSEGYCYHGDLISGPCSAPGNTQRSIGSSIKYGSDYLISPSSIDPAAPVGAWALAWAAGVHGRTTRHDTSTLSSGRSGTAISPTVTAANLPGSSFLMGQRFSAKKTQITNSCGASQAVVSGSIAGGKTKGIIDNSITRPYRHGIKSTLEEEMSLAFYDKLG